MDEVTGPVIAIALVLCAVFVPTAFMAGISGQFYKQFALTIAASTIISAFNSLTLSPALAALLLKPHGHGEHGHVQQEALPRPASRSSAAWSPMSSCWRRSATWSASKLAATAMSGAEAAAHTSAAALWALRAVVFAVGAVAGWFAGILVNRLLGAFFRGFNWFFDVTINVYGRIGRRTAARQRDRAAGLRRLDGA